MMSNEFKGSTKWTQEGRLKVLVRQSEGKVVDFYLKNNNEIETLIVTLEDMLELDDD